MDSRSTRRSGRSCRSRGRGGSRTERAPAVPGFRRRGGVRARASWPRREYRRRMNIGQVVPDSPFLLAPLAGVSDSPFRQLAREQGASMVYTEMVSADGLVRGNKATLDYCAVEPMERPVGIQLVGSGA